MKIIRILNWHKFLIIIISFIILYSIKRHIHSENKKIVYRYPFSKKFRSCIWKVERSSYNIYSFYQWVDWSRTSFRWFLFFFYPLYVITYFYFITCFPEAQEKSFKLLQQSQQYKQSAVEFNRLLLYKKFLPLIVIVAVVLLFIIFAWWY